MNKKSGEAAFRIWEAVCHKEGEPPYTILYEDEDILVCKKAPGLPVQSRSVAVKDLESMLRLHLAEQSGPKTTPYLAVIHRLDQPVQGLLVFAKNPFAAGVLSRQLTDGTMQKQYCCICTKKNQSSQYRQANREGDITVTDYLLKNGKTNRSEVVPAGTPGAKSAVLVYRILQETEEQLLLHVQLKTGRHHQIRVQLAHRGMPIEGDLKYGPACGGDGERSVLKLCAYKLIFTHPKTKMKMTFNLNGDENGKNRI